MDLDAFRASLRDPGPPASLSLPLVALWHAGRGEWERAHVLVDDASSKPASWVHAHLHRVEGDLANAAYWYRHAAKPPCKEPLEVEWATIVRALLADST